MELVNGVHKIYSRHWTDIFLLEPFGKADYNITMPAASVFSKQLGQKWK